MGRGAVALILALTVAGCESGEPTQILLTVQSDLIVSDDPAIAEMDEIRVRILRYEPTRPADPSAVDPSFPPPLRMEVGTPVTVDGRSYTFRWARDFPLSERTLPIEIGVAPEGRDPSRVALFEAYALLDGAVVVAARVRAGYVRGRVVRVLLTLDALCRDAECPPDFTCQDGACVPVARECLVDCDAGVTDGGGGLDAGLDAGTTDAATTDAGPGCDPATCDDRDPCNGIEACVAGRCAPGTPPSCDDGVGCTIDGCGATGCTHRPDDGACIAAEGGTCDLGGGCQYPSCTPSTCVPGPCQTATCMGDTCIRATTCMGGGDCCAGACVEPGCDDRNPCTTDSCGATGCVHAPNSSPCSDGLWCNGVDTCGDRACSVHAGSPCGSLPCVESSDTCAECGVDADCGAPTWGTWSACDWERACDESAQRSRTVMTPRCVTDACTTVTTLETEACIRDRDGAPCSATPDSYGPWSACTYADVCDEQGMRTRTVTRRRCASGGCYATTETETEVGGACARDTDGTGCDDGDVCTDADRCVAGTCQGRACGLGMRCGPGSAPVCDPLIGCYCA